MIEKWYLSSEPRPLWRAKGMESRSSSMKTSSNTSTEDRLPAQHGLRKFHELALGHGGIGSMTLKCSLMTWIWEFTSSPGGLESGVVPSSLRLWGLPSHMGCCRAMRLPLWVFIFQPHKRREWESSTINPHSGRQFILHRSLGRMDRSELESINEDNGGRKNPEHNRLGLEP